MKERILKELLTRAEKSGCSERTIRAYVDSLEQHALLPANEEALTDEYYLGQVKVLTAMGGQISHDTARNVEDFKKNYKPSTPPTPEPKPKPAEPTDHEKEMNEMREFMKKYKADADKAKLDALKTQVRKNLIEQGANDEFVLDYVFLSKTIDTEKSVDDIVKDCLNEYNTQYSRAHADTGLPFSGGSQGGKPVELSDEEKAEKIKANAEKYCQKRC